MKQFEPFSIGPASFLRIRFNNLSMINTFFPVMIIAYLQNIWYQCKKTGKRTTILTQKAKKRNECHMINMTLVMEENAMKGKMRLRIHSES